MKTVITVAGDRSFVSEAIINDGGNVLRVQSFTKEQLEKGRADLYKQHTDAVNRIDNLLAAFNAPSV